MGEGRADEFARDGEDQARLLQLIQRAEEIGELQAGNGIRKRRHGSLHSIAGEIDPLQKMSDLVSANAQSDLKHLRIRYFWTHGCVKAGAALLDHSEVKGCNIRDGLDMFVPGKVGIGSTQEVAVVAGNGRNIVERDGLREGGAEVWIG